MNLFQIILMGIVEGLTEFLPISSTAHIDLTRWLLGLEITPFIKSFEIIIQLGAICAVILLYGKKILKSRKYIKNICIAFIPTGIIGFILYKIIKSFLIGNMLVAGIMLLIGGIVIIFYERAQSKNTEIIAEIPVEDLGIKKLLALGVIQALAVMPGVSRSGAIIIGGRMLGIHKKIITEFSFTLAIPTMIFAVLYDLSKSGSSFSKGEWGSIVLGFLVSFIVAFVVIKWFISYIKNHSFEIFGYYRVIIGLIIILFFVF